MKANGKKAKGRKSPILIVTISGLELLWPLSVLIHDRFLVVVIRTGGKRQKSRSCLEGLYVRRNAYPTVPVSLFGEINGGTNPPKSQWILSAPS